MIKGVIFDLDGTLLDTVSALLYTTNLTLARFGYGPLNEALIKQFVGDGYRCQMERALRHSGDEELLHLEESLPVYTENFAKHCMHGVVPYDGIPELLAELKKRGIRIAVFSNKPHARTVENIETVFGKGYFDWVQGEQPGVPKKPDPTGAKRIAEQWGITGDECLYLGDTNTDMKTGLAAGLITIGVTWGFRPRAELESFCPQYIVDHPDEVMDIIRKQ